MTSHEVKTVLVIQSSIRGHQSNSRHLTQLVLEQLGMHHGELIVTERDLAIALPHIDAEWCTANYCPPIQRNLAQQQTLALSDILIAELASADIVIIGAPMYNFSIPVGLKLWIDQILRAGVTFRYTPNGPVGMLDNKSVYIVMTTGGTHTSSEIDFASGYLKHIFNFIGIHDVHILGAAGYDMNNVAQSTLIHDAFRLGVNSQQHQEHVARG